MAGSIPPGVKRPLLPLTILIRHFTISTLNQNQQPVKRIEIKDLTKGDVVYECEAGKNIPLQIISDPRRKNNGWEIDALTHEKEVYLFAADDAGHYAPRLYSQPQYI